MIGYVTLGTNDLPRAAAFYDALLAEIGARRLFDTARGIAWGVAMDKPSLGVMKPYDGRPARRQLLRRLLPRPRRQQAQRVLHGLSGAAGTGVQGDSKPLANRGGTAGPLRSSRTTSSSSSASPRSRSPSLSKS